MWLYWCMYFRWTSHRRSFCRLQSSSQRRLAWGLLWRSRGQGIEFLLDSWSLLSNVSLFRTANDAWAIPRLPSPSVHDHRKQRRSDSVWDWACEGSLGRRLGWPCRGCELRYHLLLRKKTWSHSYERQVLLPFELWKPQAWLSQQVRQE